MGTSNTKLRAFHRAVIEDDADKVRDILAENGLDVNAKGEEELSALHLAVSHGALKSLQILLGSGRLNLSSRTPSGETPLILATALGREDIALYLLENHSEEVLQMGASDHRGLTAVHHASSQGQERLLVALLERGADPEAKGGKLQHTPLMLAAQNSQDRVVRRLLEAGAKVSVADVAKATVLHHACMASAEGCVRALLEAPDIAVDVKDASGCTPLLYCLNNRCSNLEKLLVSHGASLTAALDAGFSKMCYHTWQEGR